MVDQGIPIEALEVSAYETPTDMPELDGTLEWESTTLVLMVLSAGAELVSSYSDAQLPDHSQGTGDA